MDTFNFIEYIIQLVRQFDRQFDMPLYWQLDRQLHMSINILADQFTEDTDNG
jgi:hypothetical protein